jgi:hypothetical protein
MKSHKSAKLDQIVHLLKPLPEEIQATVSGGGDSEWKYLPVRRYYTPKS